MQSQKILDYVDDVVSRVKISDELKPRLENELIRNILAASESQNVDGMEYLGSPKELADKLSLRFEKIQLTNTVKYKTAPKMKKPVPACNHHRPHSRYSGEYMREHSNTCLKLLYIPLLQISSGTERIVMPLNDDY